MPSVKTVFTNPTRGYKVECARCEKPSMLGWLTHREAEGWVFLPARRYKPDGPDSRESFVWTGVDDWRPQQVRCKGCARTLTINPRKHSHGLTVGDSGVVRI